MISRLLLPVCLSASLALTACTPPAGGYKQGGPVLNDQNPDDTGVRTVVFRYLMREHPKGQPAFVSYGPSSSGGWIDAPAVYASTLADTGVNLMPAFRAAVPPLGTNAKVVDRSSGKPGVLYYVKIVRWLDENNALVEGGRVDGPVPASGLRCIVKRVSTDIWRIDEAEPW